MKTYFESLGIGGIDGTIKSRFDDLKDRVRGKTGYIGGVRSLSGYVQNDDGHWIVFSIIFNGFQGSAKPYGCSRTTPSASSPPGRRG